MEHNSCTVAALLCQVVSKSEMTWTERQRCSKENPSVGFRPILFNKSLRPWQLYSCIRHFVRSRIWPFMPFFASSSGTLLKLKSVRSSLTASCWPRGQRGLRTNHLRNLRLLMAFSELWQTFILLQNRGYGDEADCRIMEKILFLCLLVEKLWWTR